MDKSNLEVFDSVNVYGDIINSDIHHNCKSRYNTTLVRLESALWRYSTG